MPDLNFENSESFSFDFREVPGENVSFNEENNDNSITFGNTSLDDTFDLNLESSESYVPLGITIGDHRSLTGRDKPNQHPMSAITGLLAAITGAHEYADTVSAAALNAAKSYADSLKTETITIAEGLIEAKVGEDEQRIARIEFDVNHLATEFSVVEDGMTTMSTRIEQNAQAISLRATTEYVNAQLQIQAGEISSRVTSTEFQSAITQLDGRISSIVAAIPDYDPDAVDAIWTAINQTATDITAEAARATAAESALSSRIQTAESVVQTVTRNQTVYNLVPKVYATEDASGNPYSYNGLTFAVQPDGRIKVTGTSTTSAMYRITASDSENVPPIEIDPDKDYVLSGCPENGSSQTYYMVALATVTDGSEDTESFIDMGRNPGVYIPAGYKAANIYIFIGRDYTCPSGGLIFSPMLEADPGKTNHEPSAYQPPRSGMSSIYSKISQTAEGIMMEVNALDGDVGALSTWKQTADGILSTVQSRVNNLAIGSRNLLLKSATKHPTIYSGASITFQDNVTVSEWGCTDAMRAYGNAGSSAKAVVFAGTSEKDNKAVSGQSYVYSIWVKNNRANTPLTISVSGILASANIAGGNAMRIVLQGTGTGDTIQLAFEAQSSNGAVDFTWWHPMIERGTIVSDWSPAPEDLGSRVTVNESNIAQLSDKIALVVTESQGQNTISAASIVLAINNASSSVAISADHISLAGKTIALTSDNIAISSTNFSVTSAGAITAKSGSIGGWQINSERLYKEIVSGGYTYRAGLYAGSSLSTANSAYYIRKTDNTTSGEEYPFRVTYGGHLTATDAEIEGSVTASSGKIGGWTIDSNRIYNDVTIGGITYSPRMYAPDLPTGDNGAFYVKKTEGGTDTYPFRVNYSGHLIATDAEIEGSIVASSGTIGGWEVSDHLLRRRGTIDGVTYAAGLQAPSTVGTGNAAFYVATTEDGETEYPFIVRYSGAVTATNATITGLIRAKSGTIGYDAANKITIGTNATNAAIYSGLVSLSDALHDGFYLGADGIALGKGKFKVTAAGALTATSADITGVIKASSGTIGNDATNKITIGTDATNAAIYSGMTSLSDTSHNGFYIGADGIALGKGKFKVTAAGALTATSADITGVIKASSGTIGADAANKITIGTNATNAAIYSGMTSLSDTTHNGFYVGADGIALGKGKFKVTSAGALTASDADISGTITASSGTIGGWTIDSERLYKESTINGTTYRAALYAPQSLSVSNAAFYIRERTNGVDTYKIRLQYDGKLQAKDADIEGKIVATSGSISGSLVTSGINAANITTGYLSADRIAAGTIVSGMLAANAVTAGKIAANAVTADKIAAGEITADKIAAGAITADKIAANAITVGKIKAGEITADRINVGQAGGSGADSRKIEWLTQINMAVSMALNDSQNFRIGNVRAYGYSTSLTFGFGAVGSGKYVRLYPAPVIWSDASAPNTNHEVLIAFASGNGQPIYGLTPNGTIARLGAEQ